MKFSTFATFLTVSAVSAEKLSQAAAQSRLEGAGIHSSSSGGCTNRNSATCTSYDQINTNTVDGAIDLKKACGCELTVTGGTEIGHADGTYSHGNGYKLDFQKASGLNQYILGNFEKIGNRGDGFPQWRAKSGYIYCDEGSHWDVTFH